MHLRSIGVRLTLWYVGLLATTLVVLGGSAYVLLSYSLQREIDISLNSVASALVERARRGAESAGPDSIEEMFLRHFGFIPLDPYFEMLDPAGKRPSNSQRDRRLLLSQQALENASRGIATIETIEPAGQYPVRILTRPVVVDNQVINLVQAGVSLERTHQTSRQFLLILTALLPIGLALAGGGGWLLARRSLKPLRIMSETARRITAHRLSERLEGSGTGDELDQLAQTLNETLERLDESFDQMRRFSADASHELQTPLTVLKGEIEVALRLPRSAAEYKEILLSALEEIDRLAKLVEGLMLLARADSGVLRIDHKSVDLTELVESVRDELVQLAAPREVELKCPSRESVNLHADPILLRQLVHNLVLNGIKYTPAGGSVLVEVLKQGPSAIVRVSDTGDGISQEDQERIFDRFFRSTEARSDKGGGAGLGLSIVKSIVEAHKGDIELTSRPGSGSTFTVRLPLK